MAITVKLKNNAFSQVWYDPLTGIRLQRGETSGDLAGLDCRNIIDELGKGVTSELEITEGTLAIQGFEGTVNSGNPQVYDFITQANRKARWLSVSNVGSGDLRVQLDGDESAGIILEAGQSFEDDMPYPVTTAEISLASGTGAQYRMAVK